MRYLLALLLLCAAGLGQAQTVFAPLTCYPKTPWTPAGTGTPWISNTEQPVTATGVAISWRALWCPDGKGGWIPYVHRCVEGRTCLNLRSLETALNTAVRTPDPLSAVNVLLTSAQQQPLAHERVDWLYAWDKAMTELLKVKPPTTIYLVKANPGCTTIPCTRPAYLLTNGVRGTREVARAAVGQVCRTSSPTLASGSDLWAEFGPTFASGVVALCSAGTTSGGQ